MKATKKNTKRDGLKNGFTVQNVSVSLKTEGVYQAVQSYFTGVLTKDNQKVGSGNLAYIGKTSSDNSVFLGRNEKSGLLTLKFLGEGALSRFEDFKFNFFDLEGNESFLSEIVVSTLDYNFKSPAPPTLKNSYELSEAFKQVLRSQTTRFPLLEHTSKGLAVGGKSSELGFVTEGVFDQNNLTHLCLSQKAKAAPKFLSLVLNNPQASVETCLAYLLYSSLGKLPATGVVQHLRGQLLEQYQVGTVVEQVQGSQKLSKSGGYVARSLKGVKTKLLAAGATGAEALELVGGWLGSLVKDGALTQRELGYLGSVEVFLLVGKDPKQQLEKLQEALSSSEGEQPVKKARGARARGQTPVASSTTSTAQS